MNIFFWRKTFNCRFDFLFFFCLFGNQLVLKTWRTATKILAGCMRFRTVSCVGLPKSMKSHCDTLSKDQLQSDSFFSAAMRDGFIIKLTKEVQKFSLNLKRERESKLHFNLMSYIYI